MPAKLTLADHVQTVATTERSNGMPARKYHRSLAMCVREAIDPMLLVEWNLMILQGKCPALVADKRYASGYKIDEGTGPAPTLDDQRKAMQWLADRGYGLPVQQVMLDAELRGQMNAMQAQLDIQQIGSLPSDARQQILNILAPGRKPISVELGGQNPQPLAIIDAVSTEKPSSKDEG